MKESDIQTMLPLGTVVTLEEGSKRLMIIGRFQLNMTEGKLYDYTAVLYPEGMLDANELFLFDRKDIGQICFKGYDCQEEALFKQFVLEQLQKKNLLEPEDVQNQNMNM